MKACLIERYSSGDMQLDNIGGLHFDNVDTAPSPTAGEIQVKMLGTSINPIDQLVVTGYGAPLFNPKSKFPIILGRDGVGKVLSIGAGVKGFEVGQRVIIAASPRFPGTYAEIVNLPLACVAPIPDGLSGELAAGIGYAGLTAWQSLAAVGITEATANKREIIINGASGGVGSIAVVMATAWGAKVTGTASRKNHEWLMQLGCDNVVDYSNSADMNRLDADLVVNLASPRGDHHVRDPLLPELLQRPSKVKGKAYATTVMPLLEKVTDNGLVLGIVGGFSGLLKSRLSCALHGTRYRWVIFKESQERLRLLAEFFAQPSIASVVSESHAIDALPNAFNAGEANTSKGKQVYMWGAGIETN